MKSVLSAIPFLLAATLPGCGDQPADGPPAVRLGDSICDQCNMIISDARWATATVIQGDRGPEPRLFDDFNCQVNFEFEHSDANILARWSHDHTGGEWLRTEDATFLISPNLRTPMGSNAAAFGSTSEAEAAHRELSGEVVPFDGAWARLRSVDACCEADTDAENPSNKEHHHAP